MGWMPIPSLGSGYAASDGGLICRVRGAQGARMGKLIPTGPLPAGYRRCAVWVNGRCRQLLVHRLVAEAFLGPCPAGYEVNHKNSNKADNRAANLEYVTRSENLRHRVALGIGRGEDNARAVLTEQQVHEIRRRHRDGEGYKRLGAAYGVSWGAIRSIIKRRTWNWVEESHSRVRS